MPNIVSSFIDGLSGLRYRLLKGVGTELDPSIPFVTLDPDLVFNSDTVKVASKVVDVETTLTAGAAGWIQLEIDCRHARRMAMSIVNTSNVAVTGFEVWFSARPASGLYETICPNNDYTYTTGTGENEGNSMKLIRKVSPVNPRTLAAGASTWIIFNVESYPWIYIRPYIANTKTMKFIYTVY
jgi:hypothetical protein